MHQPALGRDFPSRGAQHPAAGKSGADRGELLSVPKGRFPHRREARHDLGTACIETHMGSRAQSCAGHRSGGSDHPKPNRPQSSTHTNK